MRMQSGRTMGLLLAGAGLLALAACGSKRGDNAVPGADTQTVAAPAGASASAATYPTRAYFGDTHVHTGWSADAGLDGAVTSPEDAFRLASGQEIKSNTGQSVKLRPAARLDGHHRSQRRHGLDQRDSAPATPK